VGCHVRSAFVGRSWRVHPSPAATSVASPGGVSQLPSEWPFPRNLSGTAAGGEKRFPQLSSVERLDAAVAHRTSTGLALWDEREDAALIGRADADVYAHERAPAGARS
jgi:hypothetical protein